MEALVLGKERITEIELFYIEHGAGLRDFDATWALPLLEAQQLYVIGLEHEGSLIALAWIVEKSHNILLTQTEQFEITLVDQGPFADSGGWVFHRTLRHTGLFPALAAAVITLWFEEIDVLARRPLWGRVIGVPGANGVPLFWELVGYPLTGLDYTELWSLPFGESEKLILARWPLEPYPIQGVLRDRWTDMAHRPHPSLAGVEQTLIRRFGNVPVPEFFVVQSLALPLYTTYASAQAAMGDLAEALAASLQTAEYMFAT